MKTKAELEAHSVDLTGRLSQAMHDLRESNSHIENLQSQLSNLNREKDEHKEFGLLFRKIISGEASDKSKIEVLKDVLNVPPKNENSRWRGIIN